MFQGGQGAVRQSASRGAGGFRKSWEPTPKLLIEGLHWEVVEAELKVSEWPFELHSAVRLSRVAVGNLRPTAYMPLRNSSSGLVQFPSRSSTCVPLVTDRSDTGLRFTKCLQAVGDDPAHNKYFASHTHAVSIQYDRSGRSTGTAIVIYGNVQDAEAAKEEYDGANAKGQPITISYAQMRPLRGLAASNGRGGGDDSGPQNLRSRVDLLARLGG